jgi:tRNA pseudouridine38-40 synthase
MRTLKLTVAYDGTRLVGWQRQAAGDSVQGLLEAALSRIEGAPVTVHGAGRTDAGVHALAQVASVRLTCAHECATLTRAVNAQLPGDVRVLSAVEAPSGFHARFAARSKTYRYLLWNAPIASPFERPYVWHVTEPLDAGAMQRAAAALAGTHDFAAFQSTGSGTHGTVRTVTRSVIVHDAPSLVERAVPPLPGERLAYEIAGDGFLRHMVRAIVGTLVEVGAGRRPPESIVPLLRAGTRADAGATAPPHGLFLVRVDYD